MGCLKKKKKSLDYFEFLAKLKEFDLIKFVPQYQRNVK